MDCQYVQSTANSVYSSDGRSVHAERRYYRTTTHSAVLTNPRQPQDRRQCSANGTTRTAKSGSSEIYSILVQQCASVGNTRTALWRAGGAEGLFNDAVAAASSMTCAVVDMQWTVNNASCSVYTDILFPYCYYVVVAVVIGNAVITRVLKFPRSDSKNLEDILCQLPGQKRHLSCGRYLQSRKERLM